MKFEMVISTDLAYLLLVYLILNYSFCDLYAINDFDFDPSTKEGNLK